MLNQSGFDLWADGYDKSVGLSDEENTYPFAGYKRLLGRIYEIVLQKEGPAVLDLGFGTGVLTSKLYAAGCRVYGQDFSARMLELAREKMPEAVLIQGDFSEGLAPALRERSYDFIISTYAMHHLEPDGKLRLIREVLERLAPGGQLLIGDVAFRTRAELEACRAAAGEEWDEDESYFVWEELRAEFPAAEFEQISPCAGLLRIRNAGPADGRTMGGWYLFSRAVGGGVPDAPRQPSEPKNGPSRTPAPTNGRAAEMDTEAEKTMRQYLERAKELRAIVTPHYNCGQSVLIPFAADAGLTEEQAWGICANFGGGLKRASACGAITAGLVVLGLFGIDNPAEYYQRLRANHEGMLDCADLLRRNKELGREKKPHCDALVYECVTLVEQLLREHGKL